MKLSRSLAFVVMLLCAVAAAHAATAVFLRVGSMQKKNPQPTNVIQFTWGGQSLSVGSLATNPATTSVVFSGKSLMWSGGIHLGEPGWSNYHLALNQVTQFVDMVANVVTNPLRSESPVLAMVNGVNARSGSSAAILGTSSGLGGMTLSNLSVGTVSYSNFVTHVQGAFNTASNLTWGHNLAAICWAHGEQDTYLDQTSADNYRTNAYQLYGSMVANIKAITGQTNDPPWLFTQSASSSWYGSANSLPALAQYRLARQDPTRMKVICPTYVIPPQSDGLHFLTDGYRYVGEQAAKVYSAGSAWMPLMPTNVVLSATNVLVTFHVPVPPLVWDTNAVSFMTNYGFGLIGGTVSALPQLVSSNSVSVPYTGSPTFLQYAWANGGTTNNGPQTGQRGNLRDSDTAMAISMPTTNLYNWCLVFRTYLYTNAAPTGLTATPSSGNVLLSWNYLNTTLLSSIKRSLVSGGPYTVIGSSPTNGYVDTSASSGVTNYYVVSSLNDAGESANSTQVNAIP